MIDYIIYIIATLVIIMMIILFSKMWCDLKSYIERRDKVLQATQDLVNFLNQQHEKIDNTSDSDLAVPCFMRDETCGGEICGDQPGIPAHDEKRATELRTKFGGIDKETV